MANDFIIKSKESLGRQKDKEALLILKALLEKSQSLASE